MDRPLIRCGDIRVAAAINERNDLGKNNRQETEVAKQVSAQTDDDDKYCYFCDYSTPPVAAIRLLMTWHHFLWKCCDLLSVVVNLDLFWTFCSHAVFTLLPFFRLLGM